MQGAHVLGSQLLRIAIIGPQCPYERSTAGGKRNGSGILHQGSTASHTPRMYSRQTTLFEGVRAYDQVTFKVLIEERPTVTLKSRSYRRQIGDASGLLSAGSRWQIHNDELAASLLHESPVDLETRWCNGHNRACASTGV